MKKEFLNFENVYETFLNLFKDELKSWGDDYEQYECETEEYALCMAESTVDDMRKYVHRKNTRMDGNFCNIREDWEITPGFIGSEVKPWGKFDDVVKSIEDGTISDEDLEKFQTWAFDWFFRAFGTYGLTYNFGEFISNIEYEREHEKECAA